jgi:hypothetical protein
MVDLENMEELKEIAKTLEDEEIEQVLDAMYKAEPDIEIPPFAIAVLHEAVDREDAALEKA